VDSKFNAAKIVNWYESWWHSKKIALPKFFTPNFALCYGMAQWWFIFAASKLMEL